MIEATNHSAQMAFNGRRQAMTPAISIIVATWNAAGTLKRCLESVLDQTPGCHELLVVDGASTDGTQEIIQAYSDGIAYWHSRPDKGIYDAWNQALGHARGDYVMFLGADDALHASDTLQRILDSIEDRNPDLVSSRVQLRDATWRTKAEFGAAWDYKALPRRMRVAHPGLLHRRSLFDRYGPFDASLRIAGDLDFLLRLPPDTRAAHLPWVTVDVQDDGISRRAFWQRIRERRMAHMNCPRVGSIRAWVYWIDKAWRMPVARLFGLPH